VARLKEKAERRIEGGDGKIKGGDKSPVHCQEKKKKDRRQKENQESKGAVTGPKLEQ